MVRLLNNFEGLVEFLVSVEDGQTLADICADYLVPIDDVIADNGLITEPKAGEVIYIRKRPAHLVKPEFVQNSSEPVFKTVADK